MGRNLITQLIEMPLEDGGTVMREVERVGGSGSNTRGLGTNEIAAKATLTFQEAREKIRATDGAVIANFCELSAPAEQIEVEFGIKLGVDTNAYIASASAEANFKVTLTWNRKEESVSHS